jgi:hypothetical protein
VDATADPVLKPTLPVIWLTHPAIDFEWIDFDATADDIVIVVKVNDIDFAMSPLRPESGWIGVRFEGSDHDEIDIDAFLDANGVWTADAIGYNDGQAEFWEDLADPIIDTSSNTMVIRAPRAVIGSSVLVPRASSRLDYVDDLSLRPNFQFGDLAGPGLSYSAP